ncbi:MAG: Stealth CR1 domain-containing protein [Clostridiales bacterium]|nr:Stealth CR1 domain-containing protein [Clostridiales bacterium]
MDNTRIDFVLTWVDGNDADWLSLKSMYADNTKNNGTSINRFRDGGYLEYWFRGVEKFAPWVNHIYFVTCGQYPKWLNLNNPKITLVRHSDYIPVQYLPTFNSNVIELFIHRIEELSENFVLFNDDMFLAAPVKKEDFFCGGKPCDAAILDLITSWDIRDVFPHTMLNNVSIINDCFNKYEILSTQRKKFFTLKYKRYLISNLLLSPFKKFPGFRDLHMPTSHCKSAYERIWQRFGAELCETAEHRFRSTGDLTHWLIKWWNYCEGEFQPRSTDWGKCFELGDIPVETIKKSIRTGKYKAVCLNDSSMEIDFEKTKSEIREVFHEILPEKSLYEK